jgi:hypothetical protein
MAMSKHQLSIHGHKVFCNDDRAWHGVQHLAYHLEEAECRQMFKDVEEGRTMDFEDDDHRKFTLIDGENGTFTVVTHDKPSSWI